MPWNNIQDIHKYNEKVNNRGIIVLTDQVTIQRRSVWYFNSIRNIVKKTKRGYKTEKIAFGSYAVVHIGTTNTIRIRCVLAVILKESNNSGEYYFMNIFTGKRMHIYNRKSLSKTEEIIEQVEKLAGDKIRPIMGYGYPLF